MRKSFKRYSINQCALYKVNSVGRLAKIFNLTQDNLNFILKSPLEYREFIVPENHNPFSLKITKSRQVQEPIGELKKIHKRILRLLEPVIFPEYAHAAIKQRSYQSNATAHAQSETIATFDLKNFYGSTRSHLVYFFFLDVLRCAPDIAGILTKLTTFNNCIPTGSSLSPLLSLHAAKPMFDELNKLAISNNLIFTCYIDDLTLSGHEIPRTLKRHVLRIVKQHGYDLANHKTRIFGSDDVKHVTGIIIYKGKLRVPYSRLRTIRNLDSAIAGKYPPHGCNDVKLHEKRAGLLGEVANINNRYKHLAKNAHTKLKKAKLVLNNCH